MLCSCNNGQWAYISGKSQVPHVTHSIYHFWYSKYHPNLQFAALPIHVTMGSHCDYGILFWNFSLTFIYALVLIVGLEFKHVLHFTQKLLQILIKILFSQDITSHAYVFRDTSDWYLCFFLWYKMSSVWCMI